MRSHSSRKGSAMIFPIESGKKKHKYNAKKAFVDGIRFDSQKEANRYSELKMLEKAGHIHSLELQPSFEIVPRVKWNGKTLAKRSYKADFKYYDVRPGAWVIEDVKGAITPLYSLKRQLFLSKYPEYFFLET